MQKQPKIEQKEQYKETELGLLPESWEVVTINDLFNIQQGKQLSARESKEGKIEKLFLRTSNVFRKGIDVSNVSKMFFTKEEFEKLKLKSGDILVCEGGDIGRTALYSAELNECAYQNHLYRLRIKNENDSKQFFVLWMNYAINQRKMYIQEGNRTTIPNLSGSRLKRFKIPRPPFDEQHKITSALYAIQTAQVKTEAVIITLREFKQSMMKHLFRCGPVSLEETKNVKLKETEFGMVPDEWNLIKLGDVSTMIVPQRNKPKKFDGDIPWIRIEDFDGKYISNSKSNQKVSEETIQSMHLRQFPIGTVLCSCSGNMGICAITKEVLISNQTFIGIVPNTNLDPEYLYYLLSYSQKRLEALGIGVTIHYISRNKFEAFVIPLPSFKIQNQISLILSQIDLKIESEENKRKALEELFKSMLHNLMIAKIRVNNMVMPNAK